MTLSRVQSPELITPTSIPVIRAEKITLDNGLSVYAVNAGNEDVVKFEIIFPSGATGKKEYGIASAAHQLIDTGTTKKKAIDIAEAIDFYGSHIQTDFGPDWKTISLYSLNRFFPDTLTMLMEILEDATYPDEELENWKTRSTQVIKVNREKVSWLAKTAFNETLFSSQHPYGITLVESDIDALTSADMRQFYKSDYPFSRATLIVSGKVTDAVISALNTTLGAKNVYAQDTGKTVAETVTQKTPSKIVIEKKDAVQSGIRIGKTLFSKTHPDYPSMQIVNTILGGYFGSRLMSNIREDKGYTYGIGSGIHPHLQSGYFFITTEVGTDVREAAIAEIYKELKRLTVEPVPEQELRLVKNYLVGAFQRSLDGPFALADRFKGLHLFGLDYEYLDNYLHLLHTISAEKIMETAFNHLQPDSMNEVIAG